MKKSLELGPSSQRSLESLGAPSSRQSRSFFWGGGGRAQDNRRFLDSSNGRTVARFAPWLWRLEKWLLSPTLRGLWSMADAHQSSPSRGGRKSRDESLKRVLNTKVHVAQSECVLRMVPRLIALKLDSVLKAWMPGMCWRTRLVIRTINSQCENQGMIPVIPLQKKS